MQYAIQAVREAKPLLRGPVYLAIIYVMFMAVSTYFGMLEGRFMPVISNVSISVRSGNESATLFYGEFDKRRKCDFMSQSWFLKTPDGVSQANLRVFEKTKVRPVGPNKFGPWRVDISPDELKQQSYSYVYHRCHWLFPTITLFYEGKNA